MQKCPISAWSELRYRGPPYGSLEPGAGGGKGELLEGLSRTFPPLLPLARRAEGQLQRGSGRPRQRPASVGRGRLRGLAVFSSFPLKPQRDCSRRAGLRSAWGHITHPCQRGPWVREVNSGPQTNQLQRPGCQGVPGTLSLFLREPGPLPAILGALKSERERKSMYVPCGLLGRLLESGCEGHLRPPSLVLWTFPKICHMPCGGQDAQGARWPKKQESGSDSATCEPRTWYRGHTAGQAIPCCRGAFSLGGGGL